MFKILFVLLFSTHILANEELGFVEVKPNGRLHSNVHTRGLERGFFFRVGYNVPHITDTSPKVLIPKKDNSSNCTLYQILPLRTASPYRKEYQIFIATELNGDTGGCLVFVRSKMGGTVKIVEYSYTLP